MFRIIRDAVADQLLGPSDEMVSTVVDRTIDALRVELAEQVTGMGLAEMRGYVRVRARRTVQMHVSMLASEVGGLSLRNRTAIGAKAVEQVAHKLARQLSTRRPAPVAMRMAA